MTNQSPGDPWRGQHPVPPPPPPDATTELPVARRSWWARLNPAPKALLIIAAVVLPLCSGGAVIGALAGDAPDAAAPAPSVTGTRSLTPGPSPVVVTRTVTETDEIPFEKETVDDPSLPMGERKVRTEGVAGVRTRSYEVTIVDGEQTGKRLVSDEVTTQPVDELVAVGTKEPPPPPPDPPPGGGSEERSPCDENYQGCVPIAVDVDCEGGSGNGPAYVRGPVRIIGIDIYELDSDGDGIGCEQD